MVYTALIRKRKIEQQVQSLSEINNGLQMTNQKREIEQEEQGFSGINNGLQTTNQKT